MKISIVISTYNSEEWLHKVLLGYSIQTEKDFEIIIADDGSTSKTKDVIDSFRSQFLNEIIHVWQEDEGFRKCKILNKAIEKSNTDYLLFTDGDCIPRKDFVATHLAHRERGYFLSGGYFKLPIQTSNLITDEVIQNQYCFKISWLLKNGFKLNFKVSKLIQNKLFSLFMNWVTTTKPTWNGHNSSAYKSDIIAVNGFNELLSYGGEDRELGERLYNLGIFSKQIRYSAICLHLYHERNYVDIEKIKFNLKVRKFNKKHNVIKTKEGIYKN